VVLLAARRVLLLLARRRGLRLLRCRGRRRCVLGTKIENDGGDGRA